MIFKILLDDFDCLTDEEILRLGGYVCYASADNYRVVGLTVRQASDQLARVRRFLHENGDQWHPVEDAARDAACSFGTDEPSRQRRPRPQLRLVSMLEAP